MSEQGAPALCARALAKRYPTSQGKSRSRAHRGGAPAGLDHSVALEPLSLTIGAGEWVALLGPNGAGKSTLFRLACGLERASAGALELFGHDVTGGLGMPQRARLGVVFQRPGLDELLTVRENLELQAALGGLGRAEAHRRAHETAHALGLGDRLDEAVRTLSGGLARRADLARALVPDPDLLLLDEPATGLDPLSRASFLEELARQRRARAERGAPLTILMSTHALEEAQAADRVAMLARGRLVALGTPAELCAALGERTVTLNGREAGGAARLRDLGLRPLAGAVAPRAGGAPDVGGTGAAVFAGTRELVEHAAADLSRLGIAFSAGPPTLGHVFAIHAHEPLNAERSGGEA